MVRAANRWFAREWKLFLDTCKFYRVSYSVHTAHNMSISIFFPSLAFALENSDLSLSMWTPLQITYHLWLCRVIKNMAFMFLTLPYLVYWQYFTISAVLDMCFHSTYNSSIFSMHLKRFVLNCNSSIRPPNLHIGAEWELFAETIKNIHMCSKFLRFVDKFKRVCRIGSLPKEKKKDTEIVNFLDLQ